MNGVWTLMSDTSNLIWLFTRAGQKLLASKCMFVHTWSKIILGGIHPLNHFNFEGRQFAQLVLPSPISLSLPCYLSKRLEKISSMVRATWVWRQNREICQVGPKRLREVCRIFFGVFYRSTFVKSGVIWFRHGDRHAIFEFNLLECLVLTMFQEFVILVAQKKTQPTDGWGRYARCWHFPLSTC